MTQLKTALNTLMIVYSLIVLTINCENVNNNKIKLFENVKVGNHIFKCKLDTGADCYAIPLHCVKNVQEDLNIAIVKNKSLISNQGHRNELESIGSIILKCLACGKISNIKFIVLNVNDSPILGLNTCLKLNLANHRVK